MGRHVDTTPDFFADVPRETTRAHLSAAREACARMLRAGHPATKRRYRRDVVEHLKALTRGEGR